MAKSKKPQVYSALEVANICGVVNQTAINWIKAGHLRAFKTPGGQYRVYPQELMNFMLERKMEIPESFLAENSFTLPSPAKTVLIVDDDCGLNTVISKYLLKKYPGLQVFQAFDGFEAGSLMAKERPGFVILDLDLPGVDGFALCRRLTEDESFCHPKVLVITALQDDDIDERLLKNGILRIFKKPLNLEEIAATVQGWYEN